MKPSLKKRKKQNGGFPKIIGIVALVVVPVLIMQFTRSRSPSPITLITQPGCVIKGNISINTGKRLYHLPGMEDYESTVIDSTAGEKWFCTESEATSNGWNKAPR